MVLIGEIYLGGSEGKSKTGEIFNCGIAFECNKKMGTTGIYPFDDWEVEFIKGQQIIVARCRDVLPNDEVFNSGLMYCNQALDMISIQKNIEIEMLNPYDSNTIVSTTDSLNYLLTINTIKLLHFSLTGNLVVTDKQGNIVENSDNTVIWNPSFRYIRLSKSASNIYEAYRNLYLALENIFQQIKPYNSSGERAWLKDCLTIIGKNVDLTKFVINPSSTPIDDIFSEQYLEIRLKLFHAKKDYILPNHGLSEETVSKAYDKLLGLVKEIIKNLYKIVSGGGGITFGGFKNIFDELFGEGVAMCLTDDPTPPKETDKNLHANGYSEIPFNSSKYLGEIVPGEVACQGCIKESSFQAIDKIHKLGLYNSNGTLFSFSWIDYGLKSVGISEIIWNDSIKIKN